MTFKLASLCLLGSSLVSACSGPETSPLDKPEERADGKADGLATRWCTEHGEAADCDPCDVANWYGDGTCDSFCAMPDNDDCSGTTEAFLARTDLKTAAADEYFYSTSGYNYRTTAVATDRSQNSANGWVRTGAPLVGVGHGLHIQLVTPGQIGQQGISLTIEDSRNADDSCGSLYSMENNLSGGAQINLFSWEASEATPAACSIGGSVLATRTTDDKLELLIDVELSDGTVWVERTITADFVD